MVSITRSNDSLYTIIARDRILGKEIIYRTRTVINAAGPWADFVESIARVEIDKHLVRSKGIHIVTRKIGGDKILVTKKGRYISFCNSLEKQNNHWNDGYRIHGSSGSF